MRSPASGFDRNRGSLRASLAARTASPAQRRPARSQPALPDEPDDEWQDIPETGKTRSLVELDPGWAQLSRAPARQSPLNRSLRRPVAREATGGEDQDMLTRLWRHSVAVSIAARWLARDAGDPDPPAVARAGMLCRLGCWAVAAIEPDWLLRWWQDESRSAPRPCVCRSRSRSRRSGPPPGRAPWGCDSLVIDAAWLHSDRGRATSSRRCPTRASGVHSRSIPLGRAYPVVAWPQGSRAVADRTAAANLDRQVQAGAAVRLLRQMRPSTKRNWCARTHVSGCCWPPSGKLETGTIGSSRRWRLRNRRARAKTGPCAGSGLVCRATREPVRVLWLDSEPIPAATGGEAGGSARTARKTRPRQARTDQEPPKAVIPIEIHGRTRAADSALQPARCLEP